MNRVVAAVCVALSTLVGVVGCTSSPPTLPSSTASDVRSVLTGPSSDQFLLDVTTHAWQDGGAEAAGRFDWIGQDANSSDPTLRADAEESASAIASFLLARHQQLGSVESGFLGLRKTTAAQLNPKLIGAYARALAPFLDRVVSGGPAFDSVHTTVAGDAHALRNLLSVLVADPDAGRTIVTAAADANKRYEAATVDAWSKDRAKPAPANYLSDAGFLDGSVFGAAEQTGATGLGALPIGEALNATVVRLALAIAPTTPPQGPDHDVDKYFENGRLMDPETAQRVHGTDDARNYYLSLRGYLSQVGFADALAAFTASYRTATGQ